MLAQMPEVQRRAFDEVGAIEEFDANQTLTYLEAMIKEVLRLYPSVPSISRETNQKTTIGMMNQF